MSKMNREIERLKSEKYSHIKDWSDEDIELAIMLHNTYEVFSKEENWKTQESTHLKPFRVLPAENQRVMLRMANMLNNKVKEQRQEHLKMFKKMIKRTEVNGRKTEHPKCWWIRTDKLFEELKQKLEGK